jgi:hypothetical protein
MKSIGEPQTSGEFEERLCARLISWFHHQHCSVHKLQTDLLTAGIVRENGGIYAVGLKQALGHLGFMPITEGVNAYKLIVRGHSITILEAFYDPSRVPARVHHARVTLRTNPLSMA